MYLKKNKVWIPPESEELVARIFTVAHCGVRTHRGADVMFLVLNREFAIENLRSKVKEFVSRCLLCKHVKGGMLIQRPWHSTHTATQRSELLHMDFLYIGESYGSAKACQLAGSDLRDVRLVLEVWAPADLGLRHWVSFPQHSDGGFNWYCRESQSGYPSSGASIVTGVSTRYSELGVSASSNSSQPESDFSKILGWEGAGGSVHGTGKRTSHWSECGKEGVSVHVHGGRLCAVVESGPPNERRQADGAMAKASRVTSRDQLGERAVKGGRIQSPVKGMGVACWLAWA
ncbi:putative integrase zinc-binding domain-containing protein [Plasmopara halstedii]